jgi:phosphatidylethanolamine/phosphatidyl-N-methylethanolamine N-methyltransferase
MGNASFLQARKRALSLPHYPQHAKVLLIGIGTGQDLPFLPNGLQITGIDLSEEMLQQARQKQTSHHVELYKMNAENLSFADNQFDIVIMNLILGVVEQPEKSMAEAVRVVKPQGQIVVFDKFVTDHKQFPWLRKMLNPIANRLGTDITRQFSPLLEGLPVTVVHQEPSIMKGFFQIYLLEKHGSDKS